MIKLISVDLDRTLLNEHEGVSRMWWTPSSGFRTKELRACWRKIGCESPLMPQKSNILPQKFAKQMGAM